MTVALDTFETVCNTLSDAIIVLDHDGHIRFLNHAAAEALQVAVEEVAARPLDACPATTPLLPLLEPSGPSQPQTVQLASGVTCQGQCTLLPEEGSVITLKLPSGKNRFSPLIREVVHELKGPISATKGFIDLVEALGDLNDKQRTFLQRAQGSLESMSDLVHEMLDMAWLEADGTLTFSPVDLNEMVRHAISQYEGYAHHQDVSITADLPPGECKVQADARWLEGAFSNFLSNAIKYSPDGGLVQISISPGDRQVSVNVSDQGVGIEPEHLPHIFKAFYRVRTRETQRIEGSGLGLSIAKTIIEKHGGEVHVQSTPGKGSVFSFSLPENHDQSSSSG
jgi:signal transduction histidine kinase